MRFVGNMVLVLLSAATVAARWPQDRGVDPELVERIRRAQEEQNHREVLRLVDSAEPQDLGWTPAVYEMNRGLYRNKLEDAAGAERSAREGLAQLGEADAPAVEANLHLVLGAACYKQDRLDEAIAELRTAVDRGTTEPDLANSYLAAALARSGELEEAEAIFDEVLENLEPGSLPYQSAQDWRRKIQEGRQKPGEGERWELKLSGGVGHSSNALRYNFSDLQLPGGVSDTSSFFWDATLYAHYDVYRGDDDGVRLYDSLHYRRYEQARSISTVSNTLGALYYHQVDEQLQVGASFNWQNVWLLNPGRKFVRSFAPGAYAYYEWDRYNATQLNVSHAWTNYHLSGNSGVRNPDGRTWTLRAEHTVYLDEPRTFALIGGLGTSIADARGADWDYWSYDASLGFNWQATEQLNVSGGMRVAWTDFDHDHSAASTPKSRMDTTVSPFASVSYQFTPYFGVTGQAAWASNDSNIGVFRYDDFQYMVTPYLDVGGLVSDLFSGED